MQYSHLKKDCVLLWVESKKKCQVVTKMDGKQLKQFIKLSESKLLDRYLSSRGISYDNLTPIQKISFSKSSSFLNWVKTNGARQDVFKEEITAEGWDKLTPQQKAHEYNLDAAQREMDRRHAQGEDMKGAKIDKKTYKIVKPKQQGVAEEITADDMARSAHMQGFKIGREGSGNNMDRAKAQHGDNFKHYNAGFLKGRNEKAKSLKAFGQGYNKKRPQPVAEKYTAKELKMAGGIAKDKRYAGGNMTGASKVMDKIRAGLSQTKQAQKALRQANEESKQIDELNKDTLYSYAKKSEKDQGDQFDKIGKGIRDKDPKSANAASHKFTRRSIGQNNAEKRLNSESLEIPELQLSELTSNLLARYKTRASASAKAADQAGNYKKGDKRFKGILNATKKQFGNDLKKHNQTVTKEEIEDWEKEDKSVATYGKKPKFKTVDPKDSLGSNKPQAAAILSGGKTLTGAPRDTIEIDPIMRLRQGQVDDPSKKINKK